MHATQTASPTLPPTADALIATSLTWLGARLDALAPGWAEDPQLHARARQLSEGFTATGQPVVTPPMSEPHVAAAYLAYFGPRAVAASAAVLAPFAHLGPTSAADLGAGTGCASLPLRALGLESQRLLDHDPRALEIAGALIPNARQMCTDLRAQLPRITTDWVLSAFALSELCRAASDAEETERFDRLLDVTEHSQLLFILDGGDRQRGRRMQRLRERAIERERHVLAPCPHAEPCPALARPRDWCHTRVPRALSAPFAAFAAGVGRDPNEMSLSYLVVSAHLSPSDLCTDDDAGAVRVIGRPRKEKGRSRVGVCGAGGLRQLQVLKRHKAAARFCNALEPGDVLSHPGLPVRGDTSHLDDDNIGQLTAAKASRYP